jgi:hypothetical protein
MHVGVPESFVLRNNSELYRNSPGDPQPDMAVRGEDLMMKTVRAALKFTFIEEIHGRPVVHAETKAIAFRAGYTVRAAGFVLELPPVADRILQ